VAGEFREAIGGHPIVAEALIARGVDTVSAAMGFIDPQYYQPASIDELPGIQMAAERLVKARTDQERVCVWGDFDVDGQTSTALLVGTLRRLGFDVTYHIPNREIESHGVNKANLTRVIDDGVSLILTCDTGSSAIDEVSYASSRGVDFVITDHHDLPEKLPEAAAFVNPKLLPERHALRDLPGVGVAFLVARRLLEGLKSELDPGMFLDLVALGIVADLAEQVKDTRYYLQLGLNRLRTTGRPAIKAMMRLSDVEQTVITEDQIGYILAPRMNALGRLADAQPSVEFLLGADDEEAMDFARKLESLNAERRQLSDAVHESALLMLEREPKLLEPAALVLENREWPAGVVGLVAGRLADEYRKPVILLTHADDELARGSARSVEGIDISRAIASQADLLEGYGGHPMAAGLTIRKDCVGEFRRGIDRFIQGAYTELGSRPEVRLDAYLALDQLDLDLAEDLERLAPFGPGNPPLVLAAKSLEVIETRRMGINDEHVAVLLMTLEGTKREVLWWNGGGNKLPVGRFDLAYRVRTSNYGGRRSVQLEWIASRAHDGSMAVNEVPSVTVEDYRFHPRPAEALETLAAQGNVIWAEGLHRADVQHDNRFDLGPSPGFVIWTAPPDLDTLRSCLETVRPDRIYVFARDPGLSSPKDFLNTLIGMVKYTIQKQDGKFNLDAASAALAQTEAAVITGLELLANSGVMQIAERIDRDFVLTRYKAGDRVDIHNDDDLRQLLVETAAFRAFLLKVDKEWFSGLML
jgi:single-stranded-DNA-specific exonuclease